MSTHIGFICTKHRELGGLRQNSNDKCMGCVKDYNHRPEVMERQRTRAKKLRATLKRKVLDHYGPNCKRCEISDPDVLNIDHVEGGGAAHRKTIGGRGTGVNMYRWLIKNGYPEGYQVLCFNCNVKLHLNRLWGGNE